MIHIQAKGFITLVPQCCQINLSRVSMKVVTADEFKKLPEAHQCKKCKKAAA
jgi:hypothetical protein